MRPLAGLFVCALALGACSGPVASMPPASVPVASAAVADTPQVSEAPSAPLTPEPATAAPATVAPAADATTRAHELMAGTLAAIRDMPTGHLELALEGSFDGGNLGAPTELSGVTITGDVNPAQGAGTFHLAVPSFMDLSVDAVILGDTEYVRSNLGGGTWVKHGANGTLGTAVRLLGDATAAGTLEAALADGRLIIRSVDATEVAGVPAYAISGAVVVPAAQASEPFLLPMLGRGKAADVEHWPEGGETTELPVTLIVAADDMRPLGLDFAFTVGSNDIRVTGTFVPGEAPATIKAPKGAIKGDNAFDPPRG